MKKYILIISCLLSGLTSFCAKAGDELRKWEGEIFAGANVSIGEDFAVKDYVTAIDSKALAGYSLGAEFRRNLQRLPIDLGLRLSFSKIGHDVEWKANDNSSEMWSKSYVNSIGIAAVGDWNFNRGGVVSPFVGTGLGIAINETYGSKVKPFIMPRLGIGINDKLRVTVSANISDVAHNAMLLTVGYTFGGFSATPKANNQDEVPSDVRKLMRQSNAFMWTGVGTLCIGVPTLVTGLTLLCGADDEVGALLGGMMVGAGGLVTLSSVPFFIISHKKKNEAVRLSLRMSALSQPGTTGFGPAAPAMGLSLAF